MCCIAGLLGVRLLLVKKTPRAALGRLLERGEEHQARPKKLI